MPMSEYWTSDSQAWIMPVLVELSGEGMTSHASDWAALRSEITTRLANRGAGAMAENLLQPLDDAASSGADIAALISGLVTEYQMSVSGAAVVGGAAATAVPRFASVEPVDGRPGWWQGYDNDDQPWKYVAATDTPGDHTLGWTPAAQMDWTATAQRGPHEPGNDPAPATRGESPREQARASIEAILKSAPSLGEGVDIEAVVNSVTTQE